MSSIQTSGFLGLPIQYKMVFRAIPAYSAKFRPVSGIFRLFAHGFFWGLQGFMMVCLGYLMVLKWPSSVKCYTSGFWMVSRLTSGFYASKHAIPNFPMPLLTACTSLHPTWPLLQAAILPQALYKRLQTAPPFLRNSK